MHAFEGSLAEVGACRAARMSSLLAGSTRRYISVDRRLAWPSQRATCRISPVASSVWSASGVRSGSQDVVLESVTGLLRQWQCHAAARLASDLDERLLPVDIVQLQGGNVSGSQSEPGQQQQHGPIPQPDGSGGVAACNQSLDDSLVDLLGQRRRGLLRDRRDGPNQTRGHNPWAARKRRYERRTLHSTGLPEPDCARSSMAVRIDTAA